MAVAGPFYLAYVADDTVAFDPVAHARMDEYVFSWRRILSETDKPLLELEMRNPHIGVLNSTRMQWAWLSWLNPANNHVEPLFLGRIVANPTNVLSEIIVLQFVSWPTDYFAQRQRVAETMKVPPFWDEVFVAVEKSDDPDVVLEAYSALWCVDPITLVVTAEDILDSSDGNVDITADDHFYDALDMHDGDAPLTAVLMDATVSWTQTGRGFVDMGSQVIVTYGGDGVIADWPKPLTSLGSGWTVEDSIAFDTSNTASQTTGSISFSWHSEEDVHNDGDTISISYSETAPSSGGIGYILTEKITVGLLDPFATDGNGDPAPINKPAGYENTSATVLGWKVTTSMVLRYDLSRQRTERVLIMLNADLQAVVNDPLVTQNSETITLTGRDVGVPIVNLLDWTTIANTDVGIGEVVFPDDPTLPGGKSAQVAVASGHAGTVEPVFSDIPGTITIDGTVHWASLGTQQPTEGAQDWTAFTNVGPGVIILPRNPLYTTYAMATIASRISFPPQGTAIQLGRTVQGSNGYFFVCTLDGQTKPPISKFTFEPIWNTTYGAVTADGGVQWTCIGNVLPDGKTHYIAINSGQTGALYVTPQFGVHTALHDSVSDNGVTWVSIGTGDIPAGGTPGNVWSRSYFDSDRGKNISLPYLLMVQRAHIRKRARAVEIEFECPFELGVGITTRKTVTLHDTRIPGGIALGKVTRAELSADGDTGEVKCHVTIGCAVGRGNAVTAVPGTPVYAAPGYMQSGYQKEVNGTIVLGDSSDIGYTPIVDGPNDDGLVLPLDKAQVVISEGVKGDFNAQTGAVLGALGAMGQAARLAQQPVTSIAESANNNAQITLLGANSIARAIQQNPIYYEAQLKPVVNGPFFNAYRVTTQLMTVPKGIDLEAATVIDTGDSGTLIGASQLESGHATDSPSTSANRSAGYTDSGSATATTDAGVNGTVSASVTESSPATATTDAGVNGSISASVTESASSSDAAAASPYNNSETIALEAAITPDPGTTWLHAVDALITTLKGASIWSTFDLFYCDTVPNQNARLFNWVNPAVGQLTVHGTMTFSANQYTASDGSTGWMSSSFVVNSGHAVDGNACFGYFCLNEDTADAVSTFQSSGGNCTLGMQASSTGASIANVVGKLNTSTAASFSSLYGSTVGHFVLQQNSTTQLQAFLDGVSLGTSTQTHAVDSGTVQLFKSGAGAFTTRQNAFAHYGSKLTAGQQLILSQALYTFLTAMDVRPKSGYLGGSAGPTNVAPYKHLAMGNGNNVSMPVTTSTTNISGLIQSKAAAYPYAMIKVADPNYLNLYRFEVHSGDHAPFDISSIDRVQFATAGSLSIPFGTTCDISFAFFVENGSVYGASFQDMADLHDQNNGQNSGPTHALAAGNKLFTWLFDADTNVQTNSSQYTFAQGQWNYVRTSFRLDNAPNGFCKTWVNGTQIFNFTGQVGTPTRAPFWWNLPIYRGGSTVGPAAIWYANFELDASGTSPFASRVASPLPVPAL